VRVQKFYLTSVLKKTASYVGQRDAMMKKKMVKRMVDRREPARTAVGFSWSIASQ